LGILYTRTKVFHFKEKLESLPKAESKILAPIQVRIKPTNACAHNCWYCAYRADNLQLGKDMKKTDFIPREKILEIIDDLDQMGVKSATFSGGGDPFHYPYLLDAAVKLSKTKVKFASLTHGAALKGELARVFAHQATWIRISMDGWDDESYSYYRRVGQGEFTKIITNMADFKRIGGKCYLGVVMIIDNKNFSHIYELAKKLKDIGVNSVKMSPCIVSNSAAENNDYHKPIFDRAKENILRTVGDFADEGFEIFDTYHTLEDKFSKDYDWCPYLQLCPVIGADCNVYSCHDKAYNLEEGLLGSIRDHSFRDFWFSDKNNFFRINPKKHCNHHCVVNTNNKMIMEYLNTDRQHLDFI